MNLQMLDLSDSDIGNAGLRYLTGRLLTLCSAPLFLIADYFVGISISEKNVLGLQA